MNRPVRAPGLQSSRLAVLTRHSGSGYPCTCRPHPVRMGGEEESSFMAPMRDSKIIQALHEPTGRESRSRPGLYFEVERCCGRIYGHPSTARMRVASLIRSAAAASEI